TAGPGARTHRHRPRLRHRHPDRGPARPARGRPTRRPRTAPHAQQRDRVVQGHATRLLPYVPSPIAGATAVGLASVFGWIHTTRLRIKHGYPLEGMWGQSLKPSTDAQAAERIKLLTQENAELRAEMGSMKDRLANVERIVTDSG